MLAKLTTHYEKVYHRHCRDEAEVADHVVGLTSSLASCQYRFKMFFLPIFSFAHFGEQKVCSSLKHTSFLLISLCRKKLTRLSVNANGSAIPKNFIDKDLIQKSPW